MPVGVQPPGNTLLAGLAWMSEWILQGFFSIFSLQPGISSWWHHFVIYFIPFHFTYLFKFISSHLFSHCILLHPQYELQYIYKEVGHLQRRRSRRNIKSPTVVKHLALCCCYCSVCEEWLTVSHTCTCSKYLTSDEHIIVLKFTTVITGGNSSELWTW